MIEYIKGELTDLTPAMATVEAAGVGYGLNISLTTYSACQGKKEVKLVGANTARMMLSGMSVSELCSAISTGNAKLIQGIKGIGKMTAQRIIVDLRDKIVALGIAEEIPAGGSVSAPVNNAVRDEAVAALTMLGFAPAPTQKVVVQILQDQPALPVEQVVKLALKQIK